MLGNIPQVRLLIYLLIIGCIPTLLVLLHLWQQVGELDTIQEQIDNVRTTALTRGSKQAINLAIMDHYRGTDNFYIDKQVEKLQLLEPEIEGLQKILGDKSFADDEEARKRLEFLLGPGNTLTFNEGAVVRYPLFREVVETQVRPVEVNIGDLERLLSLVEGVSLGGTTVPPSRPQLIILDFRLDKKKSSDENELFLLNTRLLKREYL